MLELSAKCVMLRETGAAITAPVFMAYYHSHMVRIIILLSMFFSAPAVCAADWALSAARRVELIKLVRNDCGSCHGMQLTGGLGPALTPQALQNKPENSLVATILFGRPGTPMPPWQAFMTEAEAAWLVDNLMQGFPDVK